MLILEFTLRKGHKQVYSNGNATKAHKQVFAWTISSSLMYYNNIINKEV